MARPDGPNPVRTGIFGIALVACLVLVSFGYAKLPFWPQGKNYQAYFTDAGGISPGNDVTVSGAIPVRMTEAIRVPPHGSAHVYRSVVNLAYAHPWWIWKTEKNFYPFVTTSLPFRFQGRMSSACARRAQPRKSTCQRFWFPDRSR